MGSYGDEAKRILDSFSTSSSRPSASSIALRGAQSDLDKAVRRATSTVRSSPALGGNYGAEARRILDISKGRESALKSGAFAGLGRGALKALGTVGDVLGTPVRFIASAGKEISDLARGEMPSAKQLVSQTFDTSFYPSTIIPKTGNKWADTLIGLGADIALDPLTYVGLGAVSAAGRSGRISLASKYAETAAFFGKKADPKVLDDIVRLGEWALDDVERQMLNMPKGLRYQWGEGGTIFAPDTVAGKISGKVAEVGGKNTARVRALIGDIPGLAKVQSYVRPKSYGGVMNRLGRGGNLDGIDVLQEVSKYSAGLYARSSKNLVRQTILGDNADVVRALPNSPYDETVHQVIDGTAQASGRAIDPAEQQLADEIIAFRDNARATVNAEIDDFNQRRGVNAYSVGYIEDYGIPRTLTPDAENYLRDRNFGRRDWDSEVLKTVEVTRPEFIAGTPVMRARQLVPEVDSAGNYVPKKWLDTELVNPADFTVDNINAISERVLGFKWFDTRASVYMTDYVDALSRQAARIGFVDRLFDYGTDVVDGLMPKLVADPEVEQVLLKATGTLRKSQNKSADIIERIEAGGAKRADDIARLETEARQLREEVLEARRVASTRDAEIRQNAEQVLVPLEARAQELENIVRAADVDEAAATSLLRSLHVRAFPDMDDAARPRTAKELGAQIKAGARERFATVEAELKAKGGTSRQIAAQRGVLTRRERQVDSQLKAVAEARKSAKGVTAELRRTRAVTKQATKALDDAIKNDPLIAASKAKDAKYSRVANQLNQERLLAMPFEEWSTRVRPTLDEAIEAAAGQGRIIRDGKELTPLEAIRDITAAWYDDVTKTFNNLANARGLSKGQREATEKVIAQLKAAEIDMVASEVNINYLESTLRAMRENPANFANKMVNQIREGWTAFEGLGVQLPPGMKDSLFARVEQLTSADELRQFVKMFDRYAQFFRISAMFTPGFIVRNAMTAAFNNFVYGATPKDISDAISFTRDVYKKGVRRAINDLPEAVRREYEIAYRAVLASGGGQTIDIVAQPIAAGARQSKIVNKVLNSKGGQWWADGNIATETAARMGMALRSVRRGNTLDQTASIVSLFHFDYTDMSKLDEIAKVFVPFWTFATRNIPLQMMMQVSRPAMYRAYESLQRNAGIDPESMVLPGYLARKGPLQVPGLPNFIGIPDLPQLEMEEQIAQFIDPKRLLSQLYPQYRLLPELAGGRKLGIDVPFSEKPQQVRGPLDVPAYLGALLFGGATTTTQGPAFSEKAGYAATSLLPTLGQLQRLVPQLGGSTRGQERQVSSVLSTLGVPIRQVPLAEQERELQRRQYALRDYLKELRDRGFITSD